VTEIRALTTSAEGTMALAAALAGVLRSGDLVLLAGALGAGKTTFTKGLASGFGVTEPVTSPTFTLVRSYRTSAGGRVRPDGEVRSLVHADLFRLDRLSEVVDLAISEMLDDDAIAVVEWGDAATDVLGPDALVVELAQGSSPDERTISIKPIGSWESRHGELLQATLPWQHG